MAKVLIIRLSAIGDVAMTIPVIYSVARANPQDSFTVLTQSFLIPIFIHRPENVQIIGLNTHSTEKTLWGVLRFAFALTGYKFDKILDLHNVIRSRVIGFTFRLQRKPVYRVDKMREERKYLTGRPPKTIRPLRPVSARYADVFRAAGFHFTDTFISLYDEQHLVDDTLIASMAGEKKDKWIGIAPFAKHRGKIYPIDEMEEVVKTLSGQNDVTIFLFGGKGYEEAILDQWEFQYPNTRNMVGKFRLDQELALISRLDAFLCMDSANMHFASLVGTKVISIWGATHPYAGFYGYKQPYDLAIQADLPCRPCSTYGNKPCHRGDWACLSQITAEQIVQKINDYLREA